MKKLVTLILLFVSALVCAQNWERMFYNTTDEGPDFEGGIKILGQIDEQYIVLGTGGAYYYSPFRGWYCAYVIAIKEDGDTAWSGLYNGGEGNSFAVSSGTLLEDGTIVLAGDADTSISRTHVKLGVLGINAAHETAFFHVFEHDTFHAGSLRGCATTQYDASNAGVAWIQDFKELCCAKISNTGEILWQTTHILDTNDCYITNIVVSLTGRVFVFGRSGIVTPFTSSFILWVLSDTGELLATRAYTYSGAYSPQAIEGSSIQVFTKFSGWMHLLTIDETGAIVSDESFAIPFSTGDLTSISPIADGYLLTGLRGSSSVEGVLAKLNPRFETLWAFPYAYGGVHETYFEDATKTANGSILVCGTAATDEDTLDVYIASFPDTVETHIKQSVSVPSATELKAFPNPFNASVAIFAPHDAIIEIFDINGTRIAHLPKNTTIWTPEKHIVSGVYFVKTTTPNGCVAEKRIVYVK